MTLLKRMLLIALITIGSGGLVHAQDEGVDLAITTLDTDVVAIDDQTYELVVTMIITQQDGYDPQGLVVIATEWDGFEEQIQLDDGRTQVQESFIVPEEFMGNTVDVFAEVYPQTTYEYDESNNTRRTSARIPAPLSQPAQPTAPRQPNDSHSGDGGFLSDVEIPDWVLLLVGGLVATWAIGAIFSPSPGVDFTLDLYNLQIRATDQPPLNKQKGDYWVERELIIEPTRWQLNHISVETDPESSPCHATAQLVEIVSDTITARKRHRDDPDPFYQTDVFAEFVNRAYPIQGNFAWLDAEIKQMKLTITFTLYRFNGSEWQKILSKDFDKRGTYHHVIPLQSFPQRYETAYDELANRIDDLINTLVDWPFQQ